MREGRKERRREGRQAGRKAGREEERREGRKKGRKEGRREGRLEGRKEGRREEGRKAGRREDARKEQKERAGGAGTKAYDVPSQTPVHNNFAMTKAMHSFSLIPPSLAPILHTAPPCPVPCLPSSLPLSLPPSLPPCLPPCFPPSLPASLSAFLLAFLPSRPAWLAPLVHPGTELGVIKLGANLRDRLGGYAGHVIGSPPPYQRRTLGRKEARKQGRKEARKEGSKEGRKSVQVGCVRPLFALRSPLSFFPYLLPSLPSLLPLLLPTM